MTVRLGTREEAERREHEWFSPLATFSDLADARTAAEDPDPFRTCFVRDRDRVLHCGAFRRLKDKTQVFVIDEGDFYRTRLTHTLEVAQMARFLCLALRLNDTLGETLAIVHDIGHPPFGHEGERILSWSSGVNFDHNRQALRIVDVLESPYPDRPGLNLTHAVRRSLLKHGGEAGHGAVSTLGHLPEAQVADLADSTAYAHHDLEDGLRSGILTEAALDDLAIWRRATEAVDPRLKGSSRRKAVLSHILKVALHDLVERGARALRDSASTSAEEVAERAERIVSPSREHAAERRELAAFLTLNFYKHPRVLRSAATARDAIAGIVEHYLERPDELPDSYRGRIELDSLQRSVCDYVAGMTDRFAIDEWKRLAERGPRSILAPSVSLGPDTSPSSGAGPVIDLDERIDSLNRAVRYTFADRELAATALTHSSARTDAQAPNERLEFLGDSILGMLVAEQLFALYPDRAEGELSRMKSSVVNRHALRKVSLRWGLQQMMVLGPGFRSERDVPPSVVADAVEAVLGAVYLDGGLEAARRLVNEEFGPLIELASDRTRASNHKSELQHFTQGVLGFTPHYVVLSETGPDHVKEFVVAAMVNHVELAVAQGRNKRQAEQRAAKDARLRLERARAREIPWPSGLQPLDDDAASRTAAHDTRLVEHAEDTDGD